MCRAAARAYDEIGRIGLYGASHGEERDDWTSLPAVERWLLPKAITTTSHRCASSASAAIIAWTWNDEPPVRLLSRKRGWMPSVSASVSDDIESSMMQVNSPSTSLGRRPACRNARTLA